MDEGSARVDVAAVQGAQQQSRFVVPTAANVYGAVPSSAASVTPSIGGATESMLPLDVVPISQQAEVARKALLENVRRLKDSHGRTMSSLSEGDENLSVSLLNITALENSLLVAEEKYRFMQKFRSYVTSICDFLQHKAFYIEELEEQIKKLHEDRASAIFKRRAANNDDETIELEEAVKAAMSVLSKKGNNIEAAKIAAQEAFAAVRKQRDLPVKLDEFGRDLNLEKRMNMKARADARQCKRSQTFNSNKITSIELDDHKIEGESSTDESDSESQAYESQRDLVLQAADEIFSDASEEYGQLSLVKRRMEEWKREYSSSYRDAYMSLSLALIFSPYVRLELLRWDPLHKGLDFQEMKWYKLLFTYGLPEDGKDFVHDDGHADLELVPHLVEKVPTWSPPVLDAAGVAAYRFGVSVRLLRNICVWKDVFSLPVLGKVVLDELLCGKVLPHLRMISENVQDAITRTERIIASLSGIWAGPSVIGDRKYVDSTLLNFLTLMIIFLLKRHYAHSGDLYYLEANWYCNSCKLQPLVTYVLSLGRILERRNVPESDTGHLARRLKKILVDLNEYDHARSMARTFHLKEAL